MKKTAVRRKLVREVAAMAVVATSLVRSMMAATKTSTRALGFFPKGGGTMLPSTTISTMIQEMPSCQQNITEAPLWRTKLGQGDKWGTFATAIGVLDSVQADYFLDYGTLLGFVRECRNFDKDFDFSISIEWLQTNHNLGRFREALELAGFEIYRSPQDKHGVRQNERMSINGAFLLKTGLNGFHIDFFYTYTGGNKGQVENGVYYKGVNSCPRQVSGVESFRWNNLVVRIPMPYDDFLRASYGDDYMTPKRVHFPDLAEETLQTGRCLMANDRGPKGLNTMGLLVCLTDEQSITEALVLLESLRQWGKGGEIKVEIYHRKLLSPVAQRKFEKYNKVKIVDLSDNAADTSAWASADSQKDLYTQALHTTRLKRALVARPSTIFLQNSANMFETMLYQSKQPTTLKCWVGRPCVKTTEANLTSMLASVDGLTAISTYRSKSTPTIVMKNGERTVHFASVLETGHRVGAFAMPSRDFLEWMSRNEYSDDLLSFRTESGDLIETPLAYRRHLRDHWERYAAAK